MLSLLSLRLVWRGSLSSVHSRRVDNVTHEIDHNFQFSMFALWIQTDNVAINITTKLSSNENYLHEAHGKINPFISFLTYNVTVGSSFFSINTDIHRVCSLWRSLDETNKLGIDRRLLALSSTTVDITNSYILPLPYLYTSTRVNTQRVEDAIADPFQADSSRSNSNSKPTTSQPAKQS